MKNQYKSAMAKSLLWKISSSKQTYSSYLYGTMHMMCAKDFELKDKVKIALEKCRQLVMEFDITKEAEMADLQNANNDSGKISDELTEEENIEFDKIVQEQFNLSLSDVDYMAPMMIVNMMLLKAIECDDIKFFETELIKIASPKNIECGGLETALEQIEIADKIFDSKELLRQLRSAGEYKDVFSEMVTVYKSEELEKIGEFLNDERFLKEDSKEAIVLDRNTNWVKRMPGIMKNKPVFFAVGAGHLTGEKGVINLLRKKGYSVNPVYGRRKLKKKIIN